MDELKILGYIETSDGRLIPVCDPAGEWMRKQDRLLLCPKCGTGVIIRYEPTGKELKGMEIMETIYERAIHIAGENRTCRVCGHEYTVKGGSSNG